jgi:hypothetical protein
MSETQPAEATSDSLPSSGNRLLVTVAWVWVGAPFCYGLVQLVWKIPALFTN